MTKALAFKKSSDLSIGIELEYQIINPHSCALTSRAKELIRIIKGSKYSNRIKPEVTQSMIEINTSVHQSCEQMYQELLEVQDFLLEQAKILNIAFCGGGTHPFQKWPFQKIFPTPRYRKLASKFRFLSKSATVFGLHIHIGCSKKENAIYLTHILARYVPQLISLSASSPFHQGADTGFLSSRTTFFGSMPLSGVIPWLLNWNEFTHYYYLMKAQGIIGSMKDFYWDIRPKPEFGTVEIRVCDTPLTIRKAVNIAAYVQALASHLLHEKPITVIPELYHFYSSNRFQACRYGFDGLFINPFTLQHALIQEDIQETINKIEYSANKLNAMYAISQVLDDVIHKKNDALILKNWAKQYSSLQKMITEQCKVWQSNR